MIVLIYSMGYIVSSVFYINDCHFLVLILVGWLVSSHHLCMDVGLRQADLQWYGGFMEVLNEF